MEPSEKPPPIQMTRAKTACHLCRARKVRCDVARRGPPCTNCCLDQQECTVDPSTRVSRRLSRNQASKSKSLLNNQTSRPRSQRSASFSPLPAIVNNPRHLSSFPTASPMPALLESNKENLNFLSTDPDPPTPTTPLSLLLHTDSNIADQGLTDHGAGVNYINFAAYRFLRIEFLSSLSQDDVNYLDKQGCLRVPRRDLLDEFVSNFFYWIHPLLPIFNESEFWARYTSSLSNNPGGKISLFLLQAILFASCGFIQSLKLRSLGFQNVRHARKCLYRRAKLLYSLDTETDPLLLAQGALLLSLWCPRDNAQQVNYWWLTSAVHHSRVAQAPFYQQQRHMSQNEQSALKRIWWACFIRDRVMSLSLRHSIVITREAFDFEADRLTVDDIQPHLDLPGFHEESLRRSLLIMTTLICDLCIVLTDILTLVHPSIVSPCSPSRAEYIPHQFCEVKRLRHSIETWHRDTIYQLSLIPKYDRSNKTFIMFSNMLQMYYHSARILLANYEVRLEVEYQRGAIQEPTQIDRSRFEIQKSTVAITELLRELIRIDMVKCLPVSAVTCTAQTLLLNLLDQTIADYDFLAGRGCLDVVLDAMKTYQSLYDNTDLILETAHRVSLDARSMVSDNGVMGWADMLSSNPMAYLRLILTMDVTVARGSFPKDSEISSVLSAHVVEFQEALNLVKKEKSEGVVNEQEKNSDDCDEPLTVSRKSSVTDIESPRDEFTASSGDILNVTAGGVILPENWGPEMLLMVPDLELQSLLASHA